MTSSAAAIPGVRAWRARARAARKEHHDRGLGDTLTDLYTLLWFILIYGGALYSEVSRHLSTPGAMEGAVDRHWLGVAALVAGAGVAWRALRSVGPMLATPAEQYWALATPLSRRAWLAGRFTGVVVGGAGTGAAAAFTVVLLGIRGSGVGRAALVGAIYGVLVVAGSVVAQRAEPRRRWPGAVTVALMGAGGLIALAVIAAHYGGRSVPAPPAGIGPVLLALGAPLAAVSLWGAVRALPRLDRARLGAGAQVAAALVTSAVWLDLTVLNGVLEVRRWRRVGRVRSRRLIRPIPGLPDRAWALLQTELVRATRRPGALAFWAALVLVQYGVVVAAPSLAGVSRVILAYLAVGRLMPGLRTIARSDALRRQLGGSELLLRGVHVVVPALATLLWWWVTVPADPGAPGGAVASVVLVAGVVGAAYRAATRGPVDYQKALVETGVGQLPVGLVLQIARGPDVLGAVIVLRLLLR